MFSPLFNVFTGVIMTLAPTYFGYTHKMYVIALKELGKRVKDTNVWRKDSLFALHSDWAVNSLLALVRVDTFHYLHVNIIHHIPFILLNPQDVSQLRSIVWFNKLLQLGQQFYMCKPQITAVYTFM